MSIPDQIDNIESGGNPNATNSRSSASGPGGFINSTWLSVLRQHRPDIAAGKSDADLLALKNDPTLAPQMTAAYTADNQQYLAKNGVPVTPGSVYLAHFAGPQGAVKVMQADPGTPVGQILGPAAMKANPFLAGMTAQGLKAWAARKMGVQAPTPGIQPPAQNGAPAATPSQPSTLPQPSAPIFAASLPQATPQAQAQAMSVPAPPPIFIPPPPQIDLSGLQAALAARRPIFPVQG